MQIWNACGELLFHQFILSFQPFSLLWPLFYSYPKFIFYKDLLAEKESVTHFIGFWEFIPVSTRLIPHWYLNSFYLAGMICHLIALYIPRSVIYMEFAVDIWVRDQMMNSRFRKFRIGISEWDNLELVTRT